MPIDLTQTLVIGISTRALFDIEKENSIFETEGLDAYNTYQREHENVTLPPGTAMPLVRGILKLNELAPGGRRCEVVVMSRNSPDLSIRVFKSIEYHQLQIVRGAFTSGASLVPYLKPFSVDLFLSRNKEDAQLAVNAGFAAALIYAPPDTFEEQAGQIRIAFDADAVVFSGESEKIFQEQGLDAFLKHERENVENPMKDGPFARLLRTIASLQNEFPPEKSPIRTAIVTARNSPAHERLIKTLRTWNVRVDEAFFMGGVAKTDVLKAFGAHIFFDDSTSHVEPASHVVPTALVPRVTEVTSVEGVKLQESQRPAQPAESAD